MLISNADVTHALVQIRSQLAPGGMFQPEGILDALGMPKSPDYLDMVRNLLGRQSDIEPVTVSGAYWRFR